jgi:2-polyprenyl-6-methoxyphenol hydroxylase-like FAD-dependent oxidoreductase
VSVADAGEQQNEVQARFLIGADGMHSTTRKAAGIAFRGGAYEQSFVLADVTMDWPLAASEVQLFFSPDGLAVVAPLPGGHHRIVATVNEAPERPTSEYVQALLAARGPGNTTIKSIAWSSRFRVQHRLATHYRRDAIFLVGDAAHVHSPAGGQGMNTGIQDAMDLANSLKAVLSGSADVSTLDGYEKRRRPIAQGVVSLTDRMTRVATLRNPGVRLLRNVAITVALSIPALKRKLAMRIAELS